MSKQDQKTTNGRTVAEWTTFVASCLVLLAVVSLIVVQMREPLDAPAPIAALSGEVRVVDGHHHVGVVVENKGDLTASNVQVTAELVIDGTTTAVDQTIDFLAGDETVDLVFVFDDDPADGQLTVTVGAYTER